VATNGLDLFSKNTPRPPKKPSSRTGRPIFNNEYVTERLNTEGSRAYDHGG
jgi:hypothetical protein